MDFLRKEGPKGEIYNQMAIEHFLKFFCSNPNFKVRREMGVESAARDDKVDGDHDYDGLITVQA